MDEIDEVGEQNIINFIDTISYRIQHNNILCNDMYDDVELYVVIYKNCDNIFYDFIVMKITKYTNNTITTKEYIFSIYCLEDLENENFCQTISPIDSRITHKISYLQEDNTVLVFSYSDEFRDNFNYSILGAKYYDIILDHFKNARNKITEDPYF